MLIICLKKKRYNREIIKDVTKLNCKEFLTTVKNASVAMIRATAGFCNNSNATDYKDILLRAATIIEASDNKEDVKLVLKKVQFYAATLYSSMDIAIPWNEMSNEYIKLIEYQKAKL